MTRSLLASACALICLSLVACSDDDSSTSAPAPQPGASNNPNPSTPSTPDQKSADIVDTAVGAGQFKTLVAAVQAAGLESTLRGAGPYTVFAPSDAAFAKLPDFLLTKLTQPAYKASLGLILKYHVLSGSVRAADVLGKTQNVATASGAEVAVDGSNNKVVINGSANVTTPDITASNGVIHVIDTVLLPSIADTAARYEDGATKFSTLASAVSSAGLLPTLAGPGSFTVFAPTDAAFANLKSALGNDAFAAILADKAKLTKILTYHVLPKAAYAKDVMTGAAATVEGGNLNLTVANGSVKVGDSTTTAANVVLADVPNRNGVIHVIDKVLLPPGL